MVLRSYNFEPAFRPWHAFLLILVTIFTVEAAVMVLLPILLPSNTHELVAPLVDACLLTVLVSPVVWHFIVQPLRRLAVLRSQVLSHVLAAQEDERRRLARDLHDEVGQGLTTLLVGLRTLEESGSLAQAMERARQLRELGGRMHDEIRRLARGLRPSTLDDLGLVAAVERMSEEYAQAHGIQVQFDVSGAAMDRLPDAVETALFRIIQEALTNIAKHADAQNVAIVLRQTPDAVQALIRDDGRGFDLAQLDSDAGPRKSLGLSSIQERAILIRGDVAMHSRPGQGTTIEVTIPLSEIQHGKDSRVAGG